MIGPYLGCHKIKYSILDEFIKEFPSGKHNRIFIDLDYILYTLYNKRVSDSIDLNTDRRTIIKSVFDILGHYRHYFKSRYNVSSDIYLYYSSSRPSNLLNINPIYNFDRYNSIKNPQFSKLCKFIREEMEVIKEFIDYFPDTYLIDMEYIDSELLPYVIKDMVTKPTTVDIIISGRLKSLQYIDDRTVIFNIGKTDKSIVTLDSFWDSIYKKNRLKSTPKDIDISYHPMILALMGTTSGYGLDGVSGMGLSSACKFISKNIESGVLPEKFIYTKSLVSSLEDIESKDLKERIDGNIRCMQLKYGFDRLTKADLTMIKSKLVNIPNVDMIHQVDREIFNSSVNLNFILNGVSDSKTHNSELDVII